MHSLIENNLAQIRELCEKHKVKNLYIFGSALRADFRPEESDVDFIVELSYSSPHEHRLAYFGLLRAMEDILSTKVDMIELSTISNPYFLEAVMKTKKGIYNAA